MSIHKHKLLNIFLLPWVNEKFYDHIIYNLLPYSTKLAKTCNKTLYNQINFLEFDIMV